LLIRRLQSTYTLQFATKCHTSVVPHEGSTHGLHIAHSSHIKQELLMYTIHSLVF